MEQPPKDVKYVPVDDAAKLMGYNPDEFRAGIVAHAVRLGKRPPIGQGIGFSVQYRNHEVENEDTVIDPDGGVPVTEKVWVWMQVTQTDIDNAHLLINGQDIKYREPKMSTMTIKRKP